MIPPGSPPPLYRTPSLLPSVITTLFESWPVQKPLQVWFFWLGSSLTCLGRARKGNGWTSRSPFPSEQAWEKPALCFLSRAELVREHSPSGSHKSSMWLRNWNCLLGDVIADTVITVIKTTGKSLSAVVNVIRLLFWSANIFVLWKERSSR